MNGTKDQLPTSDLVAALPEGFEIKAFTIEDGVGEDGEFVGYAAHFGNLDHDGDIILPGAFKNSLRTRTDQGDDIGPNIEVLWMHDVRVPIGRTREAAEDVKGLRFRARISQTTQGKDALILLRDKVVRRMSFGYRVIKAVWVSNDTELAAALAALQVDPQVAATVNIESKSAFKQGRGVRLLVELDVWEVSPVSFPANDKAIIEAVKSRGVLTSASATKENAPVSNDQGTVLDDHEAKAGRVLSAKNLKALKSVADGLSAAAETLRGVIKAAEPEGAEDGDQGDGKSAEPTTTPQVETQPELVEDLEALTSLTTDFVSAFNQ